IFCFPKYQPELKRFTGLTLLEYFLNRHINHHQLKATHAFKRALPQGANGLLQSTTLKIYIRRSKITILLSY
ncbi:MAG: hypothetical protein WAN57_00120, partial [Smithella sp.]